MVLNWAEFPLSSCQIKEVILKKNFHYGSLLEAVVHELTSMITIEMRRTVVVFGLTVTNILS